MVVAVGETETAVPDVTEPIPLSILPTPLTNIAFKLTLDPVVMIASSDEKLLITGPATTLTVVDDVSEVPASFMTVKV